MAIPFYNQADQDIYASGDKFIPQEQYRLNYAPPSIMGQNTNLGITNTQAASPYIWPPQGGGGDGGGVSSNKFGLNMDTEKTIQQGKWVGNEYVKTPRKIAQTEGGIWKDVLTNQNVYHGGLNVKTPMTMILGKFTGKKTTDDPYKGTWYGHGEWDDEEMDIGTRRTVPQNIITRWRENQEIKKQEKAATEQAEAQSAQAGRDQSRIDRAYIEETGGQAGSYGPGGGSGAHAADASGSTYSDPFDPGGGEKEGGLIRKAQGGRIGYRYGDPVIPEDETEDVFELMRDQNIPISEQVEGDPFQMRIQELMGKGLSWDDAYDIAEMEFQDLFAEAPDSADEGLASLV